MSNAQSKNFIATSTAALRRAGFRLTKQRVAVLECISTAKKPLSAPEIYESLTKGSQGAPLDKVSVYRILETLLQLHLVHRVTANGSYIACTHQECASPNHIISRCTSCNEVKEVDVPTSVIAPLLNHLEKSSAFSPDTHLLQVDGVCDTCAD